ncbi:MAG: hypothetical protein IKG15_11385 [Solobacterium sp.]|nr:hypothetical protein [Solobacterium sp.]
MKKLLMGALGLTLALALTACSGGNGGANGGESGGSAGEVKKGGTYIIGVSGEATTLNPDATADDYNYAIVQNLYSRLYKLGNDFEAKPDLAESYELSEDGMKYTFHLRSGVVWTDGEPCTSADVKYTYDEIIKQNYAFASVFENVDTIETPDDLTVVFNMKNPDPSFMGNVSWYGTFILPKHIYEGTDWLTNPANENPVGTGPFKLDQWNKGTDIQIVPNENYFGDQPLLDRVIYTVKPDATTCYQSWLNGEIDESWYYTESEFADLEKDTEKYQWIEQLWPSPWYIVFNTEKGQCADPAVRRAIATGLNRQEVSEKGTSGIKPASEYFIPLLYKDAHNEEYKLPDYDPAKAMKILEEAGYKKDDKGYYLHITFTSQAGLPEVEQVIKANMEKIGIDLKIDSLDYTIWSEKVEPGDYEMAWMGGFQGPDVVATGKRLVTNGMINYSRYSNPEVDKLYEEANREPDPAKQNELIKKVQEYLAEDVPNLNMVDYMDKMPMYSYIKGHPSFSEKDGGSMEKAGFSEMTYVWLDK